MQIEVWKVSGSSGFHFGRHGLGQEETHISMPSDSLFAALINRLAVRVDANVDEFIRPFKDNDPPFAISSTFPFAGKVLFFPVPLAALGEAARENDAKQYKRVQYVSERLFMRLVSGTSLKDIYQSSVKLMNGAVLFDTSEIEGMPEEVRESKQPIWSIETRPRVTLGRVAQNSTIYFTARVAYAAHCGLWFGMYWRKSNNDLKKLIADLFVELGYSGLGAERSAGFGGCEIKQDGMIDLPEATGKSWVSLSRYLPRENEITSLEVGAYRIVNVGGWMDSPYKHGQRRRAVNMIEEGATLGKALSVIPGRIADVSPRYNGTNPVDHEVYRSGLALAVEWKGELK